MTDWFAKLTGFEEESPDQVRANLVLDGTRVRSVVNNAAFECGRLEIPTLGELRDWLARSNAAGGAVRVSEVVGDAQNLHADPENAGATFQVASQFNLLEMVSPNVTPEQGVGMYEHDRTQGPACAIACGAGTIYRSYFIELDGQRGQTADRQVDCLADVGEALGNSGSCLWEMRNGYCLPSRPGLSEVRSCTEKMSPVELETVRGKLRVGVQSDSQVTIADCRHRVTQVYASALPIAYCRFPAVEWEPFAQLVLDAAYEATFCAAIINGARTSNRRLYLTLLGGGAFGNPEEWIFSAIQRSLKLFQSFQLDVRIISFGRSNRLVQRLIENHS